MNRSSLVLVVGLSLAIFLGSCGSRPQPPEAVTFVFKMRGFAASESFRVATASPALIAQVRAQLALPEAQRMKLATGDLRPGDGGHNPGWSWHLTGVTLADAAVEVCDGLPSMVEADLNYWLNTVKGFCPWASYAAAELP